MKLYFAEGEVLLNGHKRRHWELHEGESVLCQRLDRAQATCLSLRQGVLVAEGYAVEHWGEQVVLRPQGECWHARPTVQRTATMQGQSVTCTAVLEPGQTVVWLDLPSQSATATLPPAEQVDIVFSASLMAVGVACRVGERTYLAVLDLMGFGVLYEGWVHDFSLQEELRVICIHADMRQHREERIMGYRQAQFCTLAHSFLCENEHMYIPQLVPYLFAEALAIGAYEEAKSYVVADLAAMWEDLLTYVGTVRVVCVPPVACEDNSFGVVDDAGVGKVFVCTMQCDRIADLRQHEIA